MTHSSALDGDESCGYAPVTLLPPGDKEKISTLFAIQTPVITGCAILTPSEEV
jgi:hypothetical protein